MRNPLVRGDIDPDYLYSHPDVAAVYDTLRNKHPRDSMEDIADRMRRLITSRTMERNPLDTESAIYGLLGGPKEMTEPENYGIEKAEVKSLLKAIGVEELGRSALHNNISPAQAAISHFKKMDRANKLPLGESFKDNDSIGRSLMGTALDEAYDAPSIEIDQVRYDNVQALEDLENRMRKQKKNLLGI